MKELNKIATQFEESIFSSMSRLANEHKAINLSQGFPNFAAPTWVIDHAVEALGEINKNQYSPSSGTPSLIKALSNYYHSFYGLSYKAEHITITNGCTEALFCAGLSILNPDDEVILFEPYYDSYPAICRLTQAKMRFVTLLRPDFKITEAALHANITAKTKLIFINNPHNPTGRVFEREELEIVAKVAIQHDLYVISDEVYEHLVFDQRKHTPIATLPGMFERTLTLSSLGKTFGLTGWKIGWACGNAQMTKALRNIHQFNTFCANHPFQAAAAKALEHLPDYLPEFLKLYQGKRDFFIKGLKETSIKPIPVEGSYFVMGEIPGELSDIDFCKQLITQCQVAAIPPSAFYTNSKEGQTMVRFCFAKDDQTLALALEQLKALS